jgi:serine/threonine protein phosphatase PrpC
MSIPVNTSAVEPADSETVDAATTPDLVVDDHEETSIQPMPPAIEDPAQADHDDEAVYQPVVEPAAVEVGSDDHVIHPEVEILLDGTNTDSTTLAPAGTNTEATPEAPENSQENSEISAETAPQFQNLQYPTTIHLPNGKVGEPFEAVLDVGNIVNITGLEGLDAEGIHLDTANLRFYGVPTKPGDYSIKVRANTNTGQTQDISIRLAIVPDPKSLWLDIPSQVEQAYWKPDHFADSITGDLQLVGASKRGRSHAHKGTNRDDDFQIAEFGPGGWSISVVADGAGSHQYSRRGSQIVTNYVISRLPGALVRHLDPILNQPEFDPKGEDSTQSDAIKTALYNSVAATALQAAKLIRIEADAAATLPKDYSTTLLITLVRRVGDYWFIGGFNIGDGGIVALSLDENRCIPLSSPDGGEYAGQTRFLDLSEFVDSSKVFERLKYAVVKDFDSVVSMTDGITDPFFPTDSSLEDFALWKEFLDKELGDIYPQHDGSAMADSLVSWMDFWSPGNHDDRTITFISRSEG